MLEEMKVLARVGKHNLKKLQWSKLKKFAQMYCDKCDKDGVTCKNPMDILNCPEFKKFNIDNPDLVKKD